MEYIPMLARKSKSKAFVNIVVVFSLLIPLAYTVVSIYFAWHNKYLPAELTIGVFGFFGTELIALAWRTKNDRGVH